MKFRVPKVYSHFVYGGIQSGITCTVASAIASVQFYEENTFVSHWIGAFLISWGIMLPVVVFAAPAIRWITAKVTN